MYKEIKNLVESSDPLIRDAVRQIFNAVFEMGEAPTTEDAVNKLKAQYGDNPNAVTDGTKIVGLSAKVGMGDSEPLAPKEDELVNDVINKVAENNPIDIELPEEQDFENLPSDNPPQQPMAQPTPITNEDPMGDEAMTSEEIMNAPPAIDDQMSDDDLGALINDDGSGGDEVAI